MFEFKLPDVGEGLTEADILAWHVAVGDVVEVNQVLVEIETAKSVVELPSPVAGTVAALRAEVGETVPVGTVIIAIEDGTATAPAAAEQVLETAAVDDAGEEAEEKPLILVGTGPAPTVAPTRRLTRNGSDPAAPTVPTAPASRPDGPSRPGSVRAKPPVRFLARQLGVDLATVQPVRRIRRVAAGRRGSGPGERGADGGARRTGCAGLRGGPRDPHADQGCAEGDGRGDDRLGVHRAARDGVLDRRRDPDDGPARPAEGRPRVGRRTADPPRAGRHARCC